MLQQRYHPQRKEQLTLIEETGKGEQRHRG